jgi:hypothetical protein
MILECSLVIAMYSYSVDLSLFSWIRDGIEATLIG